MVSLFEIPKGIMKILILIDPNYFGKVIIINKNIA
jgi:hypothetical protein